MALIVACIAAAGSRVAITGGIYAYTEAGLGPFVGFLAGALYWAAALFGGASVAVAFVGSVAVLWPAADQGAIRIVGERRRLEANLVSELGRNELLRMRGYLPRPRRRAEPCAKALR